MFLGSDGAFSAKQFGPLPKFFPLQLQMRIPCRCAAHMPRQVNRNIRHGVKGYGGMNNV